MRRLKTLSLALTGLALALPTAAQAGAPNVCTTCNGQPAAPHVHQVKKKTGHLCAACAAKAAAANGGYAPAMAMNGGVPCATCAGGVAPGTSAPGFASVGGGDPSQANLLAVGGSAPGFAVVGGTVVSSEPAPVGVVRTNFATPEMPGSLGASVANRAAAPSAGPGGVPYAKQNEIPPGLYTPAGTRRRPHVLSRMMGVPDFGRRRAEAESRARESHAQMSYGPASAPTDLPPSMVFGGGH